MPPNPRLLLVKLSSLGDVIHNLPVATDIQRAFPSAVIDWATEGPYTQLVTLHPSIRSALPVRLRQLKSRWYDPSAWSRFFDDKSRLVAGRYDLVLDTQGLVKSALIASWPGGPVAGYDRNSIREPLASRWYDKQFAVSRELHAVERNRALAAAALGYAHLAECDYGLPRIWPKADDLPATPYVVCLHASSRADKRWPASSWIALGRQLNAMGLNVVLPSGSAAEFAQSQYVAKQLELATPLAARSMADTAGILAHARAVIGVDTGLAHLAVALKRPTIGLYLSTQPALTGLYSGHGGNSGNSGGGGSGGAINLGGGTRKQIARIEVEAVIQHLRQFIVQPVVQTASQPSPAPT